MADIKEIADALTDLSLQEMEMLRHAQEHPDIPVVRTKVSSPPPETKWWLRFEKRTKNINNIK